jgi:putative oxidoreductase
METDIGLLILRVVVGGLLIGHGTQKLFGWFGGYGFAGTRGFLGSQLRLRPAGLWTAAAGLSEAGGGLLLAVGLLDPLGSLGIVAAMLMAIVLAHWPRLWATNNGFEYPLVLATVAVAAALAGPGAISLDHVLGIVLPEPATFVAGLVAVVLGCGVALASRSPAAVQPAQRAECPRAA